MSASASLVDDASASDPTHRIAVAAHEIRTPLGGVLALADLLLAEDLTEAARGHASALKSAAEHLLEIATTLLGGEPVRRPDALAIDDLLTRVGPPIAARAMAKGLIFRATRGPGVPDRVVADEGALRQIVDNLADNALRATARGSVELAIERVGGAADAVTLRIALRDTGPGVGDAPERLFEPYVQGMGPSGAAGLGLTVVAEAAKAMGGRLEASNRPSGGAEFAVVASFPAVDRPGPATSGARVLVAEDNEINRRVMVTLLEHFGMAYDMVENGEAAVAAVAAGEYDVVLMDAVMPVLDGLSATRQIRALDGPKRAVRVVGVTARAFNDEIRAFREAGADAVVTKPISVAALWSAIGEHERRWA